MIHFTSDQHYGHDFVRTYSNRPFANLAEMDGEMVKRHNEVVGNLDVVFHIGDFTDDAESSASKEHYIKQLKGRHIFIRGNHIEDDNTVIEKAIIKIGEQEICLAHDIAPNNLRYKLSFVGHVHEKWEVWKDENFTLVNVSVDVWNFYPTTFRKIMDRVCKFKVGSLR